MPSPPRASPQVPQNGLDPEPDSGLHPVVRNDLRKVATLTNVKGFLLLMSVVGGSFAASQEIDKRVDAGLSVLEQKHNALVDETRTGRAAQEVRLIRVEAKQDNQGEKLDAILDAMHVPLNRRPAPFPHDGGN